MPERRAPFRIVRDLIAHELARLRRVPLLEIGAHTWREDSAPEMTAAEREAVASLLAEYAALPPPDPTLAAPVAQLAARLADPATVLTFRTSGSTGAPKPCRHRLRDLLQEAAGYPALLPPVRRLICCVPCHHIYGTIWTALVPAALGDVPVEEARFIGPGLALPALGSGDLVMATPALWRHILHGLDRPPAGVAGLTSTAPMPADLARGIVAAGIAPLCEIYGSSEHAGIGFRTGADDPFTLQAQWRVEGEDALVRLATDGERPPEPLMDHLGWIDARGFRVTGRRDAAVQVGGINVHPARIAREIAMHEGVADCAVRLADTGRLKAFVVPADPDADTAVLADALRAWARTHLEEAERPRRYSFGPALPRTESGKLRDWE